MTGGSKTPKEASKIKRILRIHYDPPTRPSISANAVAVLVGMLRDVSQRLIALSHELMLKGKKSTLQARDVQIAVRLEFIGELAKWAIVNGMAAVVKWDDPGLCLKPSFYKREMKESNRFPRISKYSYIYLAGVMDFLCIEILEISFKAAQLEKRSRITPNDIRNAIARHHDLSHLFMNGILVGAGGIDCITRAMSTLSTNNNTDKKNNNIENDDDDDKSREACTININSLSINDHDNNNNNNGDYDDSDDDDDDNDDDDN